MVKYRTVIDALAAALKEWLDVHLAIESINFVLVIVRIVDHGCVVVGQATNSGMVSGCL